MPSNPQIAARPVRRSSDPSAAISDAVAVEEPLEIRLGFTLGSSAVRRSIAVTMRTPGHDAELAVGFLVGEGLLSVASTVTDVRPCNDDPTVPGAQNVIRVDVEKPNTDALSRLDRNFYTTSSCGVCGKASIDAIAVPVLPVRAELRVDGALIPKLPARLRDAQPAFGASGGIHGAGLFNTDGTLVVVREDVGRHNALDKLIGRLFLDGELPATEQVLLLSGRASFELIQKALVAGIRFIAAVGAPSTLAIDLAARHGATLVGFVRGGTYNIYTGAERIEAPG